MPDTKKHLSAMVYMDFENIKEFLRRYGKTPLEMHFFPKLLSKFKRQGFKIADFLVYGDFEQSFVRTKQQTYLRNLGLQTRQSFSGGKNISALELTVEALRNLFRNPGIDVFIFIISDRDIIPLLKTIRLEGKLSYLLSIRDSFNQIVAEYADHHEYLEDIFRLTSPVATLLEITPLGVIELKPVDQIPTFPDPAIDLPPLNGANYSDAARPEVACSEAVCLSDVNSGVACSNAAFSSEDIERAKEIAQLFYNSRIWRRAVQLNEPVNLNGYTQAINKAVRQHSGDLMDSIRLAHALQFITIYSGPDQKLYIKEGAQKGECVE